MNAAGIPKRTRRAKTIVDTTSTHYHVIGPDRAASQHFDSEADAVEAAETLAEQHPGTWYCLYQSVADGRFNVPVALYGVFDEQLLSPHHTPIYLGIQCIPVG